MSGVWCVSSFCRVSVYLSIYLRRRGSCCTLLFMGFILHIVVDALHMVKSVNLLLLVHSTNRTRFTHHNGMTQVGPDLERVHARQSGRLCRPAGPP